MASLVVAGDTSGSVTLSAPSVSGSTVLTLPTTTGTLVVTGGAQTIEFADGSAAAPSITNSGDTNTGIFFPAADTIAFSEGGTEVMRIDSTGAVGIGTTNPNSFAKFAVNGNFGITAGQFAYFYNSANSNYSAIACVDTTGTAFYTATTERMRINSSGLLLVGTTSATATGARLTLRGTQSWAVGPQPTDSTFYVYNESSQGVYILNGGTSWASSSDERKKDIIEPISDAVNKVLQLRAVIGKYKIDKEGTRRSFLIAQDVQKVLPEAVNELNDKDKTLGVQYTDVIPLLVAAIKEQQQIINDLKARIETLENT